MASERDGQGSRFHRTTATISFARRAVLAAVLILTLAVLEANLLRQNFERATTLLSGLQQKKNK